jgi:dephospho-CoA kinase
MAKIIGITGGIGSGKTTVCKVFEELGAPIYNADVRAKAVMSEDANLIRSIMAAFGKQAYVNGKPNSPYLAEVVFSSEDSLKTLNSLVHPAVARDFIRWVNEHNGHPYIIKEAAILFESGAYKAVDETVLVIAPEDIRIHRVIQRDGMTEAEVRRRMANQWPEERKMKMADHILVNDGLHLVLPKVLELHHVFSDQVQKI